MNMKSITTIVLSFLLTTFGIAQSAVFDIRKYGAPSGDITTAFGDVWKAACNSTGASKVWIPSGSYKMGAIVVKGPCNGPIEVQVDGTIIAPANPAALHDAYEWIKFEYVDFFTLSGKGVFDGQGAIAWNQNDCGKNKNCDMASMNFGFNFLKHATVRDITSKDSKNFHVNVLGCTNFTFDHFTVTAPATSLNTDGIHIGRSTDVKILNTNIGTGDDCVSLGDGCKQITVQNVNCGPGHGISVGSLGKYPKEEPVEQLLVKNCTLTNTDNGVRIKTWPSTPGTNPITDMHFEDITMVDVLNPVIIDQEYCPWNQCSKQSPSKIKISKVTFKNIKGTSKTKDGVILICSKSVPCEGVELNNVALTFNGTEVDAKCVNVKPIVTGKAPKCVATAAA
ncbi:polygalacturonase-like isoform X2 [Cicer arietinum]|uniref:Polygalacturonase-like isoform X1 n=1 Tax=Cicer arietinum TaxID=3827 RepID=A0A1S2XNT7_CICAR|nr:polygalacturonase-like isoform X1 [Cicer arietinum]